VVSGTYLGSEYPDKLISVPPHIKTKPQWWLKPFRLKEEVPLVPPPVDCQTFTDVSTLGWGRSGRVSGLSGFLVSARVFTPHKHSGDARIKENSPGSLPSSRISLVVATDNIIVIAYINKEGGSGPGY